MEYLFTLDDGNVEIFRHYASDDRARQGAYNLAYRRKAEVTLYRADQLEPITTVGRGHAERSGVTTEVIGLRVSWQGEVVGRVEAYVSNGIASQPGDLRWLAFDERGWRLGVNYGSRQYAIDAVVKAAQEEHAGRFRLPRREAVS